MTLPLAQLQHLLLDIFSTRREVPAAAVAALSGEDWQRFMAMAREHRLGPMLHWRLSRERRDLPIPETVRAQLGEAYKQSTLRSLAWQRELLLTHRILERAGIPHVALKGAYLAPHAYPHPALRPLRDLDILVPKDKALAVFQTLIEDGFTRLRQFQGTPETYLSICQHLPPLHSPSGEVNVEIHARLFHPDHSGAGTPDLAETPGYWRRCLARPVAGEAIAYASPTDLLLHLIVHAVYDHGFNNGPLVFSDLAFVLATHAIDWPLFWQLADERNIGRGCVLALRMSERYFDTPGIAWPEGLDAAPAIAEDACLLSLRSFEDRQYVNLATEAYSHGTPWSMAKSIFRKLFPPKQKIALMYPVSEDSPKVYLWYLAKWWRLATVILPRHVLSARRGHTMNEIARLARLNEWLEGDPAP